MSVRLERPAQAEMGSCAAGHLAHGTLERGLGFRSLTSGQQGLAKPDHGWILRLSQLQSGSIQTHSLVVPSHGCLHDPREIRPAPVAII